MKENHHHHQKTVETSPTSLKVQVVKAVDLKAVDGPDPDVLVNIRMISGDLSSPYQSTKLTDDCPESFLFDVLDADKSRLEVTLWQGEAFVGNFLGQVVVNVSKIKPFAGIQVHQAFNIRAGGTMPTHGSGIFEPSAICVPEGITGKLTPYWSTLRASPSKRLPRDSVSL
jgi:hypothetical protein